MAITKHHTDIVQTGWVGQMPAALRPYLYLMRLDRPIGTWLLLLPGWWAILLTGGLAQWPTLLLFSVGAILVRGAGCVVNDVWDRDLDGRVERTQTRPLPAGDVTVRQAIALVIFLCLCGFAILIQFNMLTIMLGVVSLVFIVAYPLMKRFTWWPQAFLGLTFNFGALMGWAAVTGELPWQTWILYAAGFFWTLGYDTIYAMQDRSDDALIGIKSSARYLTEKLKRFKPETIIMGFYLIHYALLWAACFGDDPLVIGGGFFISLLPLVHLRWQVETMDINDHKNTLCRFKSNRDYGLLVCFLIIILS